MTFTAYNSFVRDLNRGGIEYAAEHSRALGCSAVEFLDFCGTNAPVSKEKYPAKQIKSVLDENKLCVDCYSVYANILHEDKAYFDREIRAEIDYAAEIGSKSFHHTLIPGLRPLDGVTFESVFEEVLERTGKIAEHCASRGINCLYEPQGVYFNGVEHLGRLIEALRVDHDNVGMCADFGNSIFVDCDPVDVMRALGRYAKQIHIKDYTISDVSLGRKGEMRNFSGKYIYDVMPGEGDIDLAACIGFLKASGYDGGISLEYAFGDDEMIKSMQYIKNLWEA